jgi:hypothetical protein
VTIPKRITMSETAFRLMVADQLHQLADQIAGANRDDLLNPLAWPLVQFDQPVGDDEAGNMARRRTVPPRRSMGGGGNGSPATQS